MRKRKINFKLIKVKPGRLLSKFTGETNCFVIWKKKLAVVIDPGGEGDKIARFLKRNKLEVRAYWLTHGHPDHVGGLSKLLDDFPAPVRYHSADWLWVKCSLPLISVINRKWFISFGADRRITCGDIVAKVVLTPGHSSGSVCYWFDEFGILFSGDTIMRGCVGATIFPGGNSAKLEASIKKIYSNIPQGTKIFPGHGGMFTIGSQSC